MKKRGGRKIRAYRLISRCRLRLSFGSETVEGTVSVVDARRRLVGIRLDKSGYARAEGKKSVSTFAIRRITLSR